MKIARSILGIAVLLVTGFPAAAQLNKEKPDKLKEVGIEERLGDKIPLDLRFETSEGKSVTLESLMSGNKPVLLNPVYYDCPQLCSLVIDAVFSGIKTLKWDPGKDYTIITFSIDPKETRKLAAESKKSYIDRLENKPGSGKGWHFLTGDEDQIHRLTEAVGYKYKPVKGGNQYAHAAAIMFLSPDGTLTRYLYGIKFDEFNIRNALFEAADGEIGSTADRVLMYCYQYDPDSQSYVPVAWRFMQLGGLVTFLILGIFLGFMWLKDKKSSND